MGVECKVVEQTVQIVWWCRQMCKWCKDDVRWVRSVVYEGNGIGIEAAFMSGGSTVY